MSYTVNQTEMEEVFDIIKEMNREYEQYGVVQPSEEQLDILSDFVKDYDAREDDVDSL